MKSLIFGVSALVLLGGGCTTMPQYVDLSAQEKQNLTQRQICEFEVRDAHDQYANTRDWTLSAIFTILYELTAGADDEEVVEVALPLISLGGGIGYTIDAVQFEYRVNECMKPKTNLENQVEGSDENTMHSASLNQSDQTMIELESIHSNDTRQVTAIFTKKGTHGNRDIGR